MDNIIRLTASLYLWQNADLPASQVLISSDLMYLLALIKTLISVASGIFMVLSTLIFRKGLIRASGICAGILALMSIVLLGADTTVGDLITLIVSGVYGLSVLFILRNFDKIQNSSGRASNNQETRP